MTEKNLTYQVKPCKTYLGIEQKINESENTHAMCFLTALARMRPPNRAGPDHCSPFHGHAGSREPTAASQTLHGTGILTYIGVGQTWGQCIHAIWGWFESIELSKSTTLSPK